MHYLLKQDSTVNYTVHCVNISQAISNYESTVPKQVGTEFHVSHWKPATQTATQTESQPGTLGVNTCPGPCDDNAVDDDDDVEFKDSCLP